MQVSRDTETQWNYRKIVRLLKPCPNQILPLPPHPTPLFFLNKPCSQCYLVQTINKAQASSLLMRWQVILMRRSRGSNFRLQCHFSGAGTTYYQVCPAGTPQIQDSGSSFLHEAPNPVVELGGALSYWLYFSLIFVLDS